ncbi:hypothetical protein RchiOBHm_Chr6g0281431 [Rosa chinensis]|uniref:Uncharacterized protein n=1 Tax=Rosa chinensis TaxID=74649 RepID=A0A2P6PTI4_ROSCH|nr:hypothetical protein RchiOBHm_Chr6g0281431 [Rosa chinensis]
MDQWNYGWEDSWGYEQESLYGGGYQAYEPRKEFVEGLLAQLQASQSLLQASQAQLQASQEMLIHSNEQLKASLAQEPPFTIYEHESFFDQVEPISREEVYIEHLEQESFMQVENDDSDVDVQESELGYESSDASGVSDYTSEELVQYWESKLPNGVEIFEDDSEEDDVLSSEEDAKFGVIHHNPLFIKEDAELEVIHHNPLFVEVDIPMGDKSPSILCDGEEIEEVRTFSSPTSMEIHHELPKVESRTFSTYILNERIGIKVLLPPNPPLSGQCFYNEVIDWKGNGAIALTLSHHCQELLSPIVPMSIISTPLEKEKARRLIHSRKIEKNGKIKKLHFWPPIGVFLCSSWSCLYDTSMSPLAPNNRVVVLEKYPP